MTSSLDLLTINFKTCAQRMAKLAHSLGKVKTYVPLTVLTINEISDMQEESIDALILRYSQCVSMIPDWHPKMLIVELVDKHPDFQTSISTIESCQRLRQGILANGYRTAYEDIINTVFIRNDL